MKTVILVSFLWALTLTGFGQDEGLTVEAFNKKMNNTQKTVLIYFNANWCVPCIKLKPIIEEIKLEEKTTVEILSLDVDKNPDVAKYFEINTLPLLVIYKNGKKVWENNTFMYKADLQNKLGMYK